MKKNSRGKLIAAAILLVFTAGSAQRPQVRNIEGHLSPLMAKVTLYSGATRDVLVIGRGSPNNIRDTHRFSGDSESGAVDIWFDTVVAIKNTGKDEVTLVLKNGNERILNMSNARNALAIVNSDDSTETIELSQVKKVEFLKPARKDKSGNAMFDNWQFSPFTGEKLPEN